ncbi:MAG: hypothetical protein ACQERB_17260, partial [Promethearchaeati archaeon]
MLILIDITDKENILLDDKQNIKQINGTGEIIVKNPSSRSRLWNLEMNMHETVNTNLERDIEVGLLNPDQEFKKQYELKNLKTPVLTLEEIFDTNRNITERINDNFIYNQLNPCSLKINLINTLDVPIMDINLSRIIHHTLQNLEINPPNFGVASVIDEGNKKVLNWNIESIPPEEIAILEIKFDTMIDNNELQSLGATKITYLAENTKLSMIDPKIRGLTDSLSGI